METKKCSQCGEIKTVDQFSKNKSCKSGLRSNCKLCHNKYFREYFRDKDRMAKQVERVHRNKKRYRWDMTQYKLLHGCSKCGYNKCARALNFHHTDPTSKEFEISKGVWRKYTKEKLDIEIDKCILLCANCHAEIEEEKYKNMIT